MLPHRAPRPRLFRGPPHERDLPFGVGGETVDAHHRLYPRLLHRLDVVEEVGDAPLHEFQVLLLILLGQGPSRHHPGAAAVHLQSPDGADDHRDVGGEAAYAAFHVPELLEPDIGPEAGLGHVVVEELQAQKIPDHRGLPDGDVGEGSGVHQHRLVLHGGAEGGVDGVPHPGRHGPGHLEVLGRYGVPALVVGQGDPPDPLPEIFEVLDDGKDRHELRGDRDLEPRFHHEAVHPAPEADDDPAQGLGAEVHGPAPLHPSWIDVQAL